MRIALWPFGDVPPGVIGDLAEDLAFLGPIVVLEPAPLREEWFNPGRGQYRSGGILDALTPGEGDRVLGVVAADLYSESAPYNFVFGEARPLTRRAVVSIDRLRSPDPGRSRDRIAKEAVHELGHALGLDHCGSPGCVMAFSNSLDDVDRKGRSFCRRCQAILELSATRPRT